MQAIYQFSSRAVIVPLRAGAGSGGADSGVPIGGVGFVLVAAAAGAATVWIVVRSTLATMFR